MDNRVRLNLSVFPFPCGWYGVVQRRVIPLSFLQSVKEFIFLDREVFLQAKTNQSTKSLYKRSAAVTLDLFLVGYA